MPISFEDTFCRANHIHPTVVSSHPAEPRLPFSQNRQHNHITSPNMPMQSFDLLSFLPRFSQKQLYSSIKKKNYLKLKEKENYPHISPNKE